MIEDSKLRLALALVTGRLHRAQGDKRCGCGPCACRGRGPPGQCGYKSVSPVRPCPRTRHQSAGGPGDPVLPTTRSREGHTGPDLAAGTIRYRTLQ